MWWPLWLSLGRAHILIGRGEGERRAGCRGISRDGRAESGALALAAGLRQPVYRGRDVTGGFQSHQDLGRGSKRRVGGNTGKSRDESSLAPPPPCPRSAQGPGGAGCGELSAGGGHQPWAAAWAVAAAQTPRTGNREDSGRRHQRATSRAVSIHLYSDQRETK